MYNNHFPNYNYPRPFRPQIPEFPFYNYDDGFGDPYFNPRPRPRFERFPLRHHHPSDWGKQWINRQIDKSQDRWLRPYRNDPPPKRQKESSDSFESARNNSETVENASFEPEEAKTEPKMPIAPKISAKEMWETSYREQVPDETATLALPSPPQQSNNTAKQKSNSARKRKGHRYNKGTYYRKGKKNNKSAAAASAQSEPGYGFDVTGTSTSTIVTSSNAIKNCTLCNMEFSGEAQAEEHFTGALHKKNANKFLTGQDPKSIVDKIDKVTGSIILPTNTPQCLSWDEPGATINDRSMNTVRFCALCSVRMTSLVTAKQHYDGKFHAKRIRIVERGKKPYRKPFKATQFISGGTLGLKEDALPSMVQQFYTPSPYQQVQTSSVTMSTTQSNIKLPLPPEFAHSMTPSGQFYCKTCNITIEHVGNLKNHLQSKAHKQAKLQIS